MTKRGQSLINTLPRLKYSYKIQTSSFYDKCVSMMLKIETKPL